MIRMERVNHYLDSKVYLYKTVGMMHLSTPDSIVGAFIDNELHFAHERIAKIPPSLLC